MFKVGDVVRVVGRDKWYEEGWEFRRAMIGKTAGVIEVNNYMQSVTLNIDGRIWGFNFKSVILLRVGEQLEFAFMKDETFVEV